MRFQNHLTSLTALLLAGAALPACAQTAPATTDADPALWVVKDADTTVYLFGTVHVLKPGMTWFDEAVKAAFDNSNELVTEVILPDQATQQQMAMAKGINPTGPSLSEKLPADKRELVAKTMASTGLPSQAWERMDPWMAGLVVAAVSFQKLGFTGDSGAEAVLTAAAKAGNKPISALETAEQQLTWLDGISEPAQVKMLVSAAEDMPKGEAVINKLIGAWSKGDPDTVGAVLNENIKDTAEFSKVMLTDRNARWAAWVKERMAKPGVVFMAVGAGHLAGADSVQAMLGRAGVKAERVRY